MTVTLRRGTVADNDLIATLHHDVWHETQAEFQPDAVRRSRDLDYFRSRVAVFSTPPLVAVRAGGIVGFSGWDNNYIGQLYLVKSARRIGVGSQLLAETEQMIFASGATHARLVVIAGNIGSRKFYEHHGWAVVSEQPLQVDTSEGPVEVGAWHMRKQLRGAGK